MIRSLESGPGGLVRICLGGEKKGKKEENILANECGLKPRWVGKGQKARRMGLNRDTEGKAGHQLQSLGGDNIFTPLDVFLKGPSQRQRKQVWIPCLFKRDLDFGLHGIPLGTSYSGR